VPVKGENTGHKGITANWVEAVLKGTELLAPGVDEIKGLQLSNAMYLSSWTDSTVDIPVDEDLFYNMLSKKIKNSRYR